MPIDLVPKLQLHATSPPLASASLDACSHWSNATPSGRGCCNLILNPRLVAMIDEIPEWKGFFCLHSSASIFPSGSILQVPHLPLLRGCGKSIGLSGHGEDFPLFRGDASDFSPCRDSSN